MATDMSSHGTGAREIGVAGTIARLAVGGIFVGTVIAGQLHAFHRCPGSWGCSCSPA